MNAEARLGSGIAGLDRVLHGGFVPGRGYLVRGGPGTGKTTLGLHFLAEGVRQGDSGLFVTLGEPEVQVRANAEALGLALERVPFVDLTPSSSFFTEAESYDLFSAAEVEGKPANEAIARAVEEADPARVVVDSMTQFRHLTTDAYQFRKQVLSFLRFLLEREATVLFTSENTGGQGDEDLQFMADGVVDLEFTEERRNLEVRKFRSSSFEGGRHAVTLSRRGMEVFPRLVPKEHERTFERTPMPLGLPALDDLLGGGIERGTVTIVSGPSGVGKTTLSMQFAREAAARGERTAVYLFEESRATLIGRCESIGMPVRGMAAEGRLRVEYVEPLTYTPEELAHRIRIEVEENGVRLVLLDSVAGYRIALRGSDLASHLHALCKYLTNMGVAAVVTNEVHGITGDFQATEAGLSFLADNLVFLRYFEEGGRLRKGIGVLKKRLSDFEETMRELRITERGIQLGPPLEGMRGLLSGVPEFVDSEVPRFVEQEAREHEA